jgi:hypothetical protein
MTFPSAGGQTYLGQGHFFQNCQFLSDFAQALHTFVQATREGPCLISKRCGWMFLYLEKRE